MGYGVSSSLFWTKTNTIQMTLPGGGSFARISLWDLSIVDGYFLFHGEGWTLGFSETVWKGIQKGKHDQN